MDIYEPKQIFFINGGLYYFDNGQWCPYTIIAVAPSNGGRKITQTIIQEDMKLHTTIFTRAQILAFGTGVIADQAIVLPKAAAGFKNQLRSITETLKVGTGGNPFTGEGQLQYFLKGFENNANGGNGLFTDNTDCINSTVNRITRVDLQNQRGNNGSMQTNFQATLNSITLDDDLKIGTSVGGFGIHDGNPDATLTIDVAYNVLKVE